MLGVLLLARGLASSGRGVVLEYLRAEGAVPPEPRATASPLGAGGALLADEALELRRAGFTEIRPARRCRSR